MAEKVAWNFLKELPDGEKFQMTTICPSLVVGKPLHTHAGFTSAEIVMKMFTGDFPIMNVKFGIVRVEDVSLAHLRAITTPEAAGKRFILSGETMWLRDMAQNMAAEFNPLGYRVKTGETSYALMWIVSIFMKEVNSVLGLWGQDVHFDHSQAEKILGIEFQSVS